MFLTDKWAAIKCKVFDAVDDRPEKQSRNSWTAIIWRKGPGPTIRHSIPAVARRWTGGSSVVKSLVFEAPYRRQHILLCIHDTAACWHRVSKNLIENFTNKDKSGISVEWKQKKIIHFKKRLNDFTWCSIWLQCGVFVIEYSFQLTNTKYTIF